MPSLMDLFAAPLFRSTIERYCSEIGWRIAEIDSRRAVIRFRMDSGRRQTLYIIRYDETLEFSVPSGLAFDERGDVPHGLSTLLLERNATKKIGFWCLENIADRKVFSFMHNAHIALLNTQHFEHVVRALIRECDEFEDAMLAML
jgi:hypothetical protein